MVTKTEVQGFFAGVEGDQDAGGRTLLPTKEKDGAPQGSLYLMRFVEGAVEIRYAASDSHPYINYRAEVVEPEEYAERAVFGMFFPPREPAEDANEETHESYDNQRRRLAGQIDAVLGPGTCAALHGQTAEAVLTELVELLENTSFVAKLGIERGKKRDPDDESKDAERYPDRNRISHFDPAESWHMDEDLPF